MKFNLKTIICSAALSLFTTMIFAANATVVSVTGKVEVNRNDNWVELKPNSTIAEGEVISTGFNSEALIRYNNSVMRLGPLTRITLEKLATSEKKDDVSVYVSTGAVRSTVKHTENKRVTYSVRNPVAVASVRGTDYLFISTGTTTCYSGAVVVSRGSDFDAKARGISHPADGKTPADEEDVKNAAEKLPGDDATIESVNPYDRNGTLVLGGQTTEIDPKTGNPQAPKNTTQENNLKLKKQTSTPSEEEAIATSFTDDTFTDDTKKNNAKASVKVHIKVKK